MVAMTCRLSGLLEAQRRGMADEEEEEEEELLFLRPIQQYFSHIRTMEG